MLKMLPKNFQKIQYEVLHHFTQLIDGQHIIGVQVDNDCLDVYVKDQETAETIPTTYHKVKIKIILV